MLFQIQILGERKAAIPNPEIVDSEARRYSLFKNFVKILGKELQYSPFFVKL